MRGFRLTPTVLLAAGAALGIGVLGGADMEVAASSAAGPPLNSAGRKALEKCRREGTPKKRAACEARVERTGKYLVKGVGTTGTGTTAATSTTAATTAGTAATTTSTATTATTATTGAPATATTGTGAALKPTQLETGRELFEGYCASCHGPLGEGATNRAPAYGPELPRSETTTGVVEQLEHAINEKGCACMPQSFPEFSLLEKEDIGMYVVELTHKLKSH